MGGARAVVCRLDQSTSVGRFLLASPHSALGTPPRCAFFGVAVGSRTSKARRALLTISAIKTSHPWSQTAGLGIRQFAVSPFTVSTRNGNGIRHRQRCLRRASNSALRTLHKTPGVRAFLGNRPFPTIFISTSHQRCERHGDRPSREPRVPARNVVPAERDGELNLHEGNRRQADRELASFVNRVAGKAATLPGYSSALRAFEDRPSSASV
jgi:hypothetical protein